MLRRLVTPFRGRGGRLARFVDPPQNSLSADARLHADKKYKEAVAVAVEACADDTIEQARVLIRRTIPVARRVLGEGHRLTLKMRKNYSFGGLQTRQSDHSSSAFILKRLPDGN